MIQTHIKVFTATVALFAGIMTLAPSSAHALTPADLPAPVSQTKATWTPIVDTGAFQDGQAREVWSYAEGNDGVMYACGKFAQVQAAGTTVWQPRGSVVAFNASGASRGQLTSFTPNVTKGTGMGVVNKCIISSDGTALIIVGSFSAVNGTAQQNISKIDLSTGQVMPFASANGAVTDITFAKGLYFLFGSFSSVNGTAQRGIATLTASGAYSPYFTSTLSGAISTSAGGTKSYRGVVTPDEQQLAAIVNTSSIDGQPRRHIAVWDLGATKASLRDWSLQKSNSATCQKIMAGRGLSAVPNSSDVVMSSTGGPNDGVCDQTMRFSTTATGGAVPVVWSNYLCADTSHAARATTGGTYSQGHMRCTEAIVGGARDFVDRNGILALDTTNGNALSWRSDQERCVGGKELFVSNKAGYPQGLWSGIDCGRGIVFRPL